MEEKVMTPINRIEPITRIVPSQQIERTEPVTIKSMKQDLLALQYRACKYNSWECYQQILELQENIRCHQKKLSKIARNIFEKYPYDGKSTFAELLAQEIKKNN